MSSWDIEQTRQDVRRLFGDDQLELARPCLRSVVDRQTYARIHFKDARAKIESYTQTALQDTSLFEVTFCDSEAWVEFNIFIREVGAHLTACVQSIHAVPDILAQGLPTLGRPRARGLAGIGALRRRASGLHGGGVLGKRRRGAGGAPIRPGDRYRRTLHRGGRAARAGMLHPRTKAPRPCLSET